MKAPWKSIIVKITVSLTIDIVLNLLGVDVIADYSEFIFDRKAMKMSCFLEHVIALKPSYSLLAPSAWSLQEAMGFVVGI
jgi:hypothetical protein